MAYRNGLQHEFKGKKMTSRIFDSDIDIRGCPIAAVNTKNDIGKKQAKLVKTRIAIRFAIVASMVDDTGEPPLKK